MAGLGRRTHYRKHLTDKVLHDFPVPSRNECIAKVVATRGGNQFDILLALPADSKKTDGPRIPQLAILPTKFRKLVWVKRSDFVIVQTGGDDEDVAELEPNDVDKRKKDKGGVRYIINHILYKEQVKHLRSEGLWPSTDPEFDSIAPKDIESSTATGFQPGEKRVSDDGIVYEYGGDYDDDNADADLFINTNRIRNLALQDSSSDESGEDR